MCRLPRASRKMPQPNRLAITPVRKAVPARHPLPVVEAEEREQAIALEQHAGDRQHRHHVPEVGLVAQGGDGGRLVHRVNERAPGIEQGRDDREDDGRRKRESGAFVPHQHA